MYWQRINTSTWQKHILSTKKVQFAKTKRHKRLKVNTRKAKVMVSRIEGERFKSKIDPVGVCGKRVMANSMFCTKCGNWVHGRCAKIKRVTARLAMRFVCLRCRGIMEGTVDLIKRLCDEMETLNGFCYLGNKLNSSGRGKQQLQQE